MTNTLKVLIAVLVTVIVVGGGFLGWIYYGDTLVAGEKSTVNTNVIVTKKVDPIQEELNTIQSDMNVSDDLSIEEIDNTTELDKIDLSGI